MLAAIDYKVYQLIDPRSNCGQLTNLAKLSRCSRTHTLSLFRSLPRTQLKLELNRKLQLHGLVHRAQPTCLYQLSLSLSRSVSLQCEPTRHSLREGNYRLRGTHRAQLNLWADLSDLAMAILTPIKKALTQCKRLSHMLYSCRCDKPPLINVN